MSLIFRFGSRWSRSRARAQGLEVRLTRFAPSPHVTYAIFSGGGLAWADAAMKRGEFALAPAPPGTRPDLAGLSCRFSPIASRRGVILSLLITKSQGCVPRRLPRGDRGDRRPD
jgi:Protein of unknown function (DUF3095)